MITDVIVVIAVVVVLAALLYCLITFAGLWMFIALFADALKMRRRNNKTKNR